ncbi:hypothetical protein [Streptomyces sp. ME19-01-6]|uniref:hypothetical protein n=1 Tax=Streptomyces sp. ME19-01-6 TaxID=3028686 RepID=UPI0029BCEC7D|nr:hypothetical protein [Streptomyces sp. ME19-01-6]MDX3229009.1 hypothetical protein [Streptomyces sp. ME19-01-6]
MTEFVFMLTRDDRTVADAHAVLDSVSGVGLRHIGFKDVGLPHGELRGLTGRIHELGARAYLEVVSVDAADELRSIEAAVGLGVDVVLGGTHVAEGVKVLDGAPVEYWPFPGRVEGHPSVLCGDAADIVASAEELAGTPGVHGLDLLAYRFAGDAAALAAAVVAAVDVPVLAAGSVDRAERIAALCGAGVWGFTAGTAVLDGSFRVDAASRGVDDLLRAVLDASRRR